MIRHIRSLATDLAGLLILGFVFYLVLNGFSLFIPLTEWLGSLKTEIPSTWRNFSTVFFSLFIEGLPFILFGVIASSFIHTFVQSERIWSRIPSHPLISVPAAAFSGLLLPVCECGIVPVARRLMEKGFPAHLAITFLLAVPIVNPITVWSTYVAFGYSWEHVLWRILTGAAVAMVMGFLFFLFFRSRPVLRNSDTEHHHDHGDCCGTCHHEEHESRISHALRHSIFELVDTGKFFVLGSLIAASFQTWIGTSAIRSAAGSGLTASMILMALAFGLSVCSSADAFLAASFRSVIGFSPLMAFMVFGPMVDVKNLLMMLGSFRKSVVAFLVAGSFLLTLAATFFMP
jgi:uncharacterized protein